MKKWAHKNQNVAIAACVFDLSGGAVPTEIQLTPSGTFRARDGRPEGLPGWEIDHVIAQRVILRMTNMAGDLVIDYEHQTLNTEKNGQPAPAAGWFKGANVEWREGDAQGSANAATAGMPKSGAGLFATNVEWTDAAKAQIAAKEYRYLSPVIAYDKTTGEVLAILMVALTNYPAIDGLGDLAAVAAARFHLSTQSVEEEHPVERKQLIAMLGLDDSATDEQIEQAIEALKAKAATADQKDTEIAALKTKAPDPAKFVPLADFEALKTEVVALRATNTASEVDALIKTGIDDGKLLPVQESWARELGTKDLAALKAYLDKTPAIAALKGTQTGGMAPEGDAGGGELDGIALAICKQMGVDPVEYKKTLAASV